MLLMLLKIIDYIKVRLVKLYINVKQKIYYIQLLFHVFRKIDLVTFPKYNLDLFFNFVTNHCNSPAHSPITKQWRSDFLLPSVDSSI